MCIFYILYFMLPYEQILHLDLKKAFDYPVLQYTAGDLYNMPQIFVYCNAISEWKKCLSLVLFIFMTGTEVHKSMHGLLMYIFLDSDFHFFILLVFILPSLSILLYYFLVFGKHLFLSSAPLLCYTLFLSINSLKSGCFAPLF